MGHINEIPSKTFNGQLEMGVIENGNEYLPDALLGSWSKINPATGSEYVKTVYVGIYVGDGYFRGSGFLIGPNTVVTSGHNLYNESKFSKYVDDNWAESIRVFSARAGESYPAGSATAVELIVPEQWADDSDRKHDWGIIRLNRDFNVGKMGFRWQSTSYKDSSVKILGYPGYVNGVWNKYMYKTQGKVSSDNDYQIYTKNTSTEGGMSGGPMYETYEIGGNIAIGIHSGHSNDKTKNIAIKITKELFDEFSTYRNLTADDL